MPKSNPSTPCESFTCWSLCPLDSMSVEVVTRRQSSYKKVSRAGLLLN